MSGSRSGARGGSNSDRTDPGAPPDIVTDDIPEAVMDELLIAFADRTLTKHGASAPESSAAMNPTVPDAAVEVDGDPTPVDPLRALGPDKPAPPAGPPDTPAVPALVAESVVVIEVDDLPDAVTLDGDPSTTGGVMDSDAALNRPKVDPRFRARRIAVRRAASRQRLRWFVVGGVVLLVVVAALVVLASPLFAIDRVEVDGNVYADPAAIQAVVDELHGDPILTADLDGAREQLEAIPWVKSARVSMHFPHRVSIELAERTPVASFQGTDLQYRVIDADGSVIAVLPNAPIDYPPITGILPNTAAGDSAGTAVHGAAQLIGALPPSLGDRLTSVALGDTGDLTLTLTGATEGGAPVEVAFGAANDYREKLIAVLSEMSRREPGSYTSIDVSTGDPITK